MAANVVPSGFTRTLPIPGPRTLFFDETATQPLTIQQNHSHLPAESYPAPPEDQQGENLLETQPKGRRYLDLVGVFRIQIQSNIQVPNCSIVIFLKHMQCHTHQFQQDTGKEGNRQLQHTNALQTRPSCKYTVGSFGARLLTASSSSLASCLTEKW